MRLKPKLSFDFLRKPNFTLKKDKLREGRVLSYWFLHIFLRGMFCSCTDENIMVSPWCIWLDYLRYPGRCLLNMLAVQREESKWTCSDWDWFGSLRHWSARSRPVFSCLPNYPKKPKQIKRPAECLCNKCIIYGNLSWNWNHSYSWLHHVLMEHLLHEVHL